MKNKDLQAYSDLEDLQGSDPDTAQKSKKDRENFLSIFVIGAFCFICLGLLVSY